MHKPPDQPRRYRARHLRDAEKLSEAEIAERLGVNQATISRDLKKTVPPAGFTDQGTPYYPPGRFDADPEYVAAVSKLAAEMPRSNACRYVARLFSGAADRQRPRIAADPERLAVMERFAKEHSA